MLCRATSHPPIQSSVLCTFPFPDPNRPLAPSTSGLFEGVVGSCQGLQLHRGGNEPSLSVAPLRRCRVAARAVPVADVVALAAVRAAPHDVGFGDAHWYQCRRM